MKDQTFIELQRHVDRAVTPLRASLRRKSTMREELLAHLIGAWDQESQCAGEGPAATDAAIQRFGDSDLIANELQASVPALERYIFGFFNKERRMWRWLVLGGLVATFVGMGLVLPALAKLKQVAILHGDASIGTTIGVALSIGVIVVAAGLHLLAWGIVRKVRKTT